MPIVGKQHKWKDSDYSLVCTWEDDTYVQWGGNGVVLGKNSYTTAFFEAFPNKRENVSGFIRGEGKTIEDAEKSAHKKYLKNKACDKHEWTRNRSKTNQYSNGLGFCKKCGASQMVFKPIVKLGEWEKSLTQFELDHYCGSALHDFKFEDQDWNDDARYIGTTYYGVIRKGIPDKDSHKRETYLKWKLIQKGKWKVRE